MPNDFTKTLIEMARYWPDLYKCRADILDQLFCTNGNGMDWEGGRLGVRKSRKANEKEFHALNGQLARNSRGMWDRMRDFQNKRVVELTRELVEVSRAGKELDPDKRKALESALNWKPPRNIPDRIRTDAQVQRVLMDRRDKRIPRTDKDRKRAKWVAERQKANNVNPDVRSVFYTLSTSRYSACASDEVPDDVRSDWLAGVGECLEMVIQYDIPAQVAEAQACLDGLEARFGPRGGWAKRKRTPPVKPALQTEV